MGFIKSQERLLNQTKPCSLTELACFHLIYKTSLHKSIEKANVGIEVDVTWRSGFRERIKIFIANFECYL